MKKQITVTQLTDTCKAALNGSVFSDFQQQSYPALILELTQRYTTFANLLEACLTYDPMVDAYKLKDLHKQIKAALKKYGPEVPL
jgi:hypothetical protein